MQTPRRGTWTTQIQISEEFTSDRSMHASDEFRSYLPTLTSDSDSLLNSQRQHTTTICHNKSAKKTPLNLPQREIFARILILMFIALTHSLHLALYQTDGFVVGFLAWSIQSNQLIFLINQTTYSFPAHTRGHCVDLKISRAARRKFTFSRLIIPHRCFCQAFWLGSFLRLKVDQKDGWTLHASHNESIYLHIYSNVFFCIFHSNLTVFFCFFSSCLFMITTKQFSNILRFKFCLFSGRVERKATSHPF